jgi:hypothetical protein
MYRAWLSRPPSLLLELPEPSPAAVAARQLGECPGSRPGSVPEVAGAARDLVAVRGVPTLMSSRRAARGSPEREPPRRSRDSARSRRWSPDVAVGPIARNIAPTPTGIDHRPLIGLGHEARLVARQRSRGRARTLARRRRDDDGGDGEGGETTAQRACPPALAGTLVTAVPPASPPTRGSRGRRSGARPTMVSRRGTVAYLRSPAVLRAAQEFGPRLAAQLEIRP